MGVELPLETAPAAAGQITVLVVEDETLIRLLVGDSLRDEGFDVVAAPAAADAIALLESGQRIDFVFTDVMMPGGMNGIGLADWIRRHHPRLPVAFASGANRSRLVELGLRDEEACFVKPVDFARLIAHIRSAVAAA